MPRTERIIFKILKKPDWILAFCFCALAVLSTLGLDLINSQQGEKSYFFAVRKTEPPYRSIPGETKPQEKKVSQTLPGEPKKKVEAKVEQQGPLPMKSPPQLEPSPPQPQPDLITSPDPKRKKGRVALIVDDMGNNLQVIEDLCSMGLPLTIAILPRSPWAAETAYIAHDHGLEVILHLPMESLNDQESNEATDGLIRANMSEEEILAIVEDSLLRVPFIQGVNNHMGSKITSDRQLMLPILMTLKRKNLYFVDSVTSGKSIAYKLARQLDIPSAERQIFLDNDSSEESILKNLFQLFRLAQRSGAAVGICHPLETTVRVLLENMASINKYNCEAVFVSQTLR